MSHFSYNHYLIHPLCYILKKMRFGIYITFPLITLKNMTSFSFKVLVEKYKYRYVYEHKLDF